MRFATLLVLLPVIVLGPAACGDDDNAGDAGGCPGGCPAGFTCYFGSCIPDGADAGADADADADDVPEEDVAGDADADEVPEESGADADADADAAGPACDSLAEGENTGFLVDGTARTFFLDLPADAETGGPWPVVFNYHGLAAVSPRPW